jgi:hypothetical protein
VISPLRRALWNKREPRPRQLSKVISASVVPSAGNAHSSNWSLQWVGVTGHNNTGHHKSQKSNEAEGPVDVMSVSKGTSESGYDKRQTRPLAREGAQDRCLTPRQTGRVADCNMATTLILTRVVHYLLKDGSSADRI